MSLEGRLSRTRPNPEATTPQGGVDFTDRNAIEDFLGTERFRPCASLKCIPAYLEHMVLYMPVCLEGRFRREGVAQHIDMPRPGRPLSPLTYTTLQAWGPLVSCPGNCKGYRNRTIAKVRRVGRRAVSWLWGDVLTPSELASHGKGGPATTARAAQRAGPGKQTGTTFSSWFRSLPRLVKAVIAASPLVALYLTYVYTGADDLRLKVYQPLYAEVAGMEESLEANSIEKAVSTSSLQSLKRSGDFGRIPRGLQTRVEEAYGQASDIGSDIPAITERVQRLVSSSLSHLRTKEEDLVWQRLATKRLEQEQAAAPGMSALAIFTFRHAGRGPGLDVRDPRNPKISSPGGPTWVINDWIGYPASVATVESLWKDNDYLYFDEVGDEWYYRLTREDLHRQGIDLRTFLDPLHRELLAEDHFRHLMKNEPHTLALLGSVKKELADRVRVPKRVADLIHD